jgi:NitT/TauT family transport system substrate-binding protein
MNRNQFTRSLLTGVALASTTRTARAEALSLTVGVPPSQDVVAVLYAQKSGMFTKAGLTITMQGLNNGAAISAAVAGGAEQVGFSSLQGLISGFQRGINFQLIAPGGMYTTDDPYALTFVRKDSPYQSARDLNGKTLASPALKDLDWIANAGFMEQNGGDFKSTKAVELPNPSLLPALLDGRVDGYTVGQPWATVALDSGKVRVLGKGFDTIATHFLMTGWFSTKETIEKNHDAIERFVRVVHDATVYTNSHKAEVVPLLAEWTKLDPSLIARTMKGSEGEYLELATIQPMIDVSLKYGLIEHAFNAADLISPIALKRAK